MGGNIFSNGVTRGEVMCLIVCLELISPRDMSLIFLSHFCGIICYFPSLIFTQKWKKPSHMTFNKKPRDPNAPKRNMSTYILYQNAMRETFKEQVGTY